MTFTGKYRGETLAIEWDGETDLHWSGPDDIRVFIAADESLFPSPIVSPVNEDTIAFIRSMVRLNTESARYLSRYLTDNVFGDYQCG